MKTLGWSGVSNTQKMPWYLTNHDIQSRVFLHASQTTLEKNIIIFFNAMILP
jgi:hypothetical protein